MTESVRGQEQESRVTRAFQESADYEFVKIDGGRFVCTAKSGKVYLVSSVSCSCPDFKHRCAGTELRCKHQVAAAHKLLAEGRR